METSLPGQISSHPWPVAAVRALDAAASLQFGTSGELLMENAGAAVARAAFALAGECGCSRVLIFCGSGNNGGDGFVAARHLAGSIETTVVLLGTRARVRGDAAANLRRLELLNLTIHAAGSEIELDELCIDESTLLVDAIFGTGLDRPVEGLARAAIERMNGSGRPILAVDIPSGLDASTGRVLGAAVRANTTITFVASKPGFHVADGPAHTGRILLAGIGIPIAICAAGD